MRPSHSAVVLLTLASSGCGPQPARPVDVACQISQSIIDGSLAPEPALDAVGAIGVVDDSGSFLVACSGTLIGPALVLTAKHCTMASNGAPLLQDGPLYFAIGADADAPRSMVEVVSAVTSLPEQGGVSELGSDVAVLELKSSITNVAPLAVSNVPLSDEQIGSLLVTYGYGSDVSHCPEFVPFRPVRRTGTEPLRALTGNVFDLIYGDHATYLARALHDRGSADLELRYQHGVLLQGYEAWAARTPGGAQICHGDSGGPVFVGPAGQAKIVGVTSWSWQSSSELCDDGSVIAILGPETRTLLATAFGAGGSSP